ncbi:MAG: aminotransferase class I/II-fold pyridoxal phosphate-dependent enzyme [Calditrichia bacterium]
MKLPFSEEERKKYFNLLNEVFDSNFWSEGQMVKKFEEKFGQFVGLQSMTVTNGGIALLALYEFAKVKGYEVIVPANTFFATVIAARMAGADVVYADCNKEDLCISLEDIKKKVTTRTKAVCVVHIGGHIAFEIEEIADFCKENGIHLIEDCAHAHGASYSGKAAGSWGLGGAYSFYATKTMPLGEGGMVCSGDTNFIEWLKYYRNYGKHVEDGKVTYKLKNGFNYRMSEMTAALGLVQLENLTGILAWKRELAKKYDEIFDRRVKFPKGMESGYYKYIVFDYGLSEETGKVFSKSDFGPEIEGVAYDLPNSCWVAEHHRCVPIWYGWEQAHKSAKEISDLLINR